MSISATHTLAALALVPKNLYRDHVIRFGKTDILLAVHMGGGLVSKPEERRCNCELTAADPRCDSGEALFRLQAKELLTLGHPERRGY